MRIDIYMSFGFHPQEKKKEKKKSTCLYVYALSAR